MPPVVTVCGKPVHGARISDEDAFILSPPGQSLRLRVGSAITGTLAASATLSGSDVVVLADGQQGKSTKRTSLEPVTIWEWRLSPYWASFNKSYAEGVLVAYLATQYFRLSASRSQHRCLRTIPPG